MVIVSVCNEKYNRAAERLGIGSFSSLQILESSLLKKQTENFELNEINGLYILYDGVSPKVPTDTLVLPKVSDARDLYKHISEIDKNEKIFLFKNNVYFDCCFREVFNADFYKSILIKSRKSEKSFAVLSSAGEVLHKLLQYENADALFASFFDYEIEYAVGYVKELLEPEDYRKLLFDIIHLQTPCKPPLLASGVFTDTSLPKGDFVIIPPVWLDYGVQIEDGTVIGPNTVLMKDCLISKNTHIKNSVIMNDVYISSECFMEGCICCNGVSVKRGAVICDNTVLGEFCTIGEDMTVEKDSFVRPHVRLELPVKSSLYREYDILNGSGYFYGLTPEKAALLGAAVGTVYGSPRICICSDGEVNSLALRLAFIGGLIATGSDCLDIGICYYSAFFYYSAYCEAQLGVYITGKGGGTKIEIFEKYGKHIGKADCYNLLSVVEKNSFKYTDSHDCKSVTQIKGLKKMYIREILSEFSKPLEYSFDLFCSNSKIMHVVSEVKENISSHRHNNGYITFKTDDEGTVLAAVYNEVQISHRELISIVSDFMNSEKRNGKIYNLGDSCYHGFYEYIRDLWKYDAVILMFKVLAILDKSDCDIIELSKNAPSFFVVEKTVKTPVKAGQIAERLEKSPYFSSNEIKTDKGNVKIKKEPHTNKLRVIAKAFSAEAAEELISLTLTLVSNESKM